MQCTLQYAWVPLPNGVVRISMYITAGVMLRCMYVCVYMEGNCPPVPITSCDKVVFATCLLHD